MCFCLFCSKTRDEVERFYSCSKCKSGTYCSKNCQRKHFKRHSKICENIAELEKL